MSNRAVVSCCFMVPEIAEKLKPRNDTKSHEQELTANTSYWLDLLSRLLRKAGEFFRRQQILRIDFRELPNHLRTPPAVKSERDYLVLLFHESVNRPVALVICQTGVITYLLDPIKRPLTHPLKRNIAKLAKDLPIRFRHFSTHIYLRDIVKLIPVIFTIVERTLGAFERGFARMTRILADF